ncbi:GDSL esterase/lipase, partial [Cucurbita argyrosperma subsp. argyrosperma]
NKVAEFAGKTNASAIISGAIYLVSAGSNDFLQNYYVNPLVYKKYTVTHNECVGKLNNDAVSFNSKLNATSQSLHANLPGLNL